MLYTRYEWAAGLGCGKRVLEVGCGPGLGLGLLDGTADFLVGSDFDGNLLGQAHATYGARVPLVQLDAQRLPFRADAFDAVLFFEGTYYVPDMDRVFDEMVRVVAPGGTVLFVNANPERPDFIPSPLSVHYHAGEEFRKALAARGLSVTVEGAFPVGTNGLKAKLLSLVRRVANGLGLIPKTLGGRTMLKRLVQGRLVEIPREVAKGYAAVAAREEVPQDAAAPEWKVIYVEGRAG